MSFISEHIIPNAFGRKFSTDAQHQNDLEKIKNELLHLARVKDVIIHKKVFPLELTVRTKYLLAIDAIQKRVNSVGFHVMPKQYLDV